MYKFKNNITINLIIIIITIEIIIDLTIITIDLIIITAIIMADLMVIITITEIIGLIIGIIMIDLIKDL